MTNRFAWRLAALAALVLTPAARADVGDPQVRTDHPWYPGELACSTFERLSATEAALYERVVGRQADDRRAEGPGRLAVALHALLPRRGGVEDLWGEGFTKGGDLRDPRVLDRPVRPRLRPVRHHARAVGRRDGGAAGPRPRPLRRRLRAQHLRGLPHRRRLRRGQVGAARPRHLHRRLRRARHGPAVDPRSPARTGSA